MERKPAKNWILSFSGLEKRVVQKGCLLKRDFCKIAGLKRGGSRRKSLLKLCFVKIAGPRVLFGIRDKPAKSNLMRISRLLFETLSDGEPAKLKKTQISRPHLRNSHKIKPVKSRFYKICRLKSFFLKTNLEFFNE